MQLIFERMFVTASLLAIQNTRKMESPETVKPRAFTAESDDGRKDRLRRRSGERERERRASETTERPAKYMALVC